MAKVPSALKYEIGKHCPIECHDGGMLALVDPTESGLDITLIARADKMRAGELKALRTSTVGVYASVRMLWFVLWAGEISWDAPHHPAYSGVPSTTAALREAAQITLQRAVGQDVFAVIVDRARIEMMRSISIGKDAAHLMAETILKMPQDISKAQYCSAISIDQSMMTTSQMMMLSIR